MRMSFKYKGRSFSSAGAMMKAAEKDLLQGVERQMKRAASLSGAQTRKTSEGLEIKGTVEQLERFQRRLRN